MHPVGQKTGPSVAEHEALRPAPHHGFGLGIDALGGRVGGLQVHSGLRVQRMGEV